MQKGKQNLDEVIKAINWPEPSANLKGRILNACDDAKVVKRVYFKGLNRVAMLFVAVTLSFVLGTVTGSYNKESYNSVSYFYVGTGTILASELLK